MRSAFRRTATGFAPADNEAQAFMDKCKLNDLVMMEGRRSRNSAQHRLYMKLLAVVYENLPEQAAERFPTFDKFRTGIKYAIGLTDSVWVAGVEHEYPLSMDYATMGQDEFEANVWGPTLDLIEEKIIPGIDRAELENEVRGLVG